MNRRKLELRAIEIRGKLNELSGIDELTEEQRTELDALRVEYRDVDAQLAAAILAEGDEGRDGPEQREHDELVRNASLGRFLHAQLEQRELDGAERDLAQQLGLGAMQVPTELLEVRATTADAQAPSNAGQSVQPVIPSVFPTPTSERMGVMRVTVPSGQQAFPVVTAPEDGVASVAEGATVSNTTVTHAADALSPTRVQVQTNMSREDMARFAQLDASVRETLSEALRSSFDREALLKADDGVLAVGTKADSSAEESFDSYANLVYSEVDGRYASGAQDITVLVGAATFAHAASKYRASSSDLNAVENLRRISDGLLVSAYVPAVASKLQTAVVKRGMQRHAVQPIWDAMTTIIDPYTGSSDGIVKVTLVGLTNVKVVRAAAYKVHGLQVEA